MYAIKAIYDGTNFLPKQPIPVSEDYEVVITFIEPVNKKTVRPPFEYGSMKGKVWMSEDFDAPCPVFGSGKGQMWISDDFDAPLDELTEYME